jgi:hypothetical protein
VATAEPPSAADPAVPEDAYRSGPRADLTCRLGLVLCALGGLIATLAPTGDLTSRVGGIPRYTLNAADAAYGIVAAVLLFAAAALPWLWARLVGIGVAALLMGFCGAVTLGGRTGDIYRAGDTVTLERGGILLTAAFWVTVAGVVVTLAFLRRPGDEPLPPPEAPRRTSGAAVASLVLGIAGLFFLVTSALAIAFASLARQDQVRSDRIGGRGLAIAGLVLGLVGLTGWTLGLGLGMLFAQP